MTHLSPEPVASRLCLDPALPIPDYLEKHYWWAYVRPWAVKLFEREWLVNLILWGYYKPLRDEVLAAWGETLTGRTLQISCCYGALTPRLSARVDQSGGELTVLDVSPAQLKNLDRKLPQNARAKILHRNAVNLGLPDAHYDRVLLFFLPHEQPRDVRAKTFAEAFRVVKPGGEMMIVEFDKPVWWHPLRLLWHTALYVLEPFAPDMWNKNVTDWFPEDKKNLPMEKKSLFFGFYQRLRIKC